MIALTICMIVLFCVIIVLALSCQDYNKKYKKYKANFVEKRKECSILQTDNIKAERKNQELKVQIEALEEKIKKCQNQLSIAQDENDSLKEKIADMQVFIERVYRVHPQIEKEIADMLKAVKLRQRDQAIETAQTMEERIKEVLKHEASKDNVELFKKALEEYNSLSMLTRNFMKVDITKLKELYRNSVELLEAYEKEQQNKT